MNVQQQKEAPKAASNLAQSPESAGQEGMSMAPPAFQLKASLKDAVSPVQRMAMAPIQMAKLGDYNDTDPKHDPSNVSDTWVTSTDEYTQILHYDFVNGTCNLSPVNDAADSLLAARLMLRALREGKAVTVAADGAAFLKQAQAQRGSAAKAESLDGKLSWQPTFPGKSNTNFGDWLLGTGAEPDASTGIMNCWELVMFSAYKAGFATKSGLKTVYTQFAADIAPGTGSAIASGVTKFENALKASKEQVYDPSKADSPKPLRGDIIIYDTLAAHVSVATGTNTAAGVGTVSLWTQNSKKVTTTTVEALLADGASGPVRFYSPNWK